MKIASLTALLLLGLTDSLLLTNTAQSLVIAINSSQPSQKISIKPPVTLQVRQGQAKELIAKLLKRQLINITDDNNPEFSKSFDELKVEPLIGQDTAELGGYKYAIEIKGKSVVLHTATPQLPKLKAYFGLLYSYTNSAQLKVSDLIICESQKPSRQQQLIKITNIAIRKGGLLCPNGYKRIFVNQPA
jgi:Type IV pilin-like G and H, putative